MINPKKWTASNLAWMIRIMSKKSEVERNEMEMNPLFDKVVWSKMEWHLQKGKHYSKRKKEKIFV